ncbi:MAG TPA: LysR substrate-binding domain-containing protein [Vicinamibacteria bacterium]|nr:LysR substrate-binding domain-containing protein [Vicinamibacteria bacterium]
MSSLEVRHLQVIEAVQRLGTVTRAASSLHLTQPAISHALREIERRLGVAVVVANGRGIKTTATGDRLAARAREILGALADAEVEARALSGDETSRLRITTECYTCYHWLPKALAELRRRLPRLQLELVPEATRRPREALRAREVDVALVCRLVEHPEIEYVPLFSDEMVALVAPDHPLASRPFVIAEDFRDQHVVLQTDPKDSTVVLGFLAPAGVEPARVSTLLLTEALVETVKAGLGVTVLSRWAVAPHLREGTLRAIPVTREGLVRHWWAAVPRGARRPGVTELVELVRERGLHQ